MNYSTIFQDVQSDKPCILPAKLRLLEQELAAFIDGSAIKSGGQVENGSLGLSTFHISPFWWKTVKNVPVWDYVDGYGDFIAGFQDIHILYEPFQPFVFIGPKADVWIDGSLVKVTKGRVKVLGGRGAGGKRGKVKVFSKSARRRLLRKMAQLKRDALPLFVTLTYPDIFSDNPADWKRDLDVFGKRIRREHSEVAIIWRMEVVPRRSGENAGGLAPHFHLLVWGADYKAMREWLPMAWYGVVASGDKKHLSAGTSVEKIRSQKGVMYYASKYIAKEVAMQIEDGVGRWWGVIGKDNLPVSEVVTIVLEVWQAIKATRLGRKMLGMSGKDLHYGLTWVISGGEFMRYLRFIGVSL